MGRFRFLIPLLCTPLLAQPADPASADPAFFEAKIRPVLVAKCYGCHASNLKAPMGGLVLDRKAGLRQGRGRRAGDRARQARRKPAAARAQLYRPGVADAAHRQAAGCVIADFTAWIAAGAPDPRDRCSPPPASPPLPAKGMPIADWPQVVGLPAGR